MGRGRLVEHIEQLPILSRGVALGPDLDDEALVREIRRSGSPDGFRLIVERYQSRVFRLMSSILGPAFAPEAEDATQEVFLAIFNKLNQFRAESRFSTWLYRVAYHKAIDHRRKLQRGRAEPLSDEAVDRPDERAASSPLRRSLSSERRRTVLAALEELAEPVRSALHLHYWLGASVREIAEVLDLKEGTVKSHLFRGRQRLAHRLAGEAHHG